MPEKTCQIYRLKSYPQTDSRQAPYRFYNGGMFGKHRKIYVEIGTPTNVPVLPKVKVLRVVGVFVFI